MSWSLAPLSEGVQSCVQRETLHSPEPQLGTQASVIWFVWGLGLWSAGCWGAQASLLLPRMRCLRSLGPALIKPDLVEPSPALGGLVVSESWWVMPNDQNVQVIGPEMVGLNHTYFVHPEPRRSHKMELLGQRSSFSAREMISIPVSDKRGTWTFLTRTAHWGLASSLQAAVENTEGPGRWRPIGPEC